MPEDAKTWLTRFLTQGNIQSDEKTRVMSKEQKEFYFVYESMAKILGIQFYHDLAEIDERIMMSYQGRRSDDVVVALSRIVEAESENIGLQPILRKLSAQAEANRK